MPTINTRLGTIEVEDVQVTRYSVGKLTFSTEAEARVELRRQAMTKVREFALWVLSLSDNLPEANINEVLPIIKAIHDSGLDYAALAAGNGGSA